MSVRVCLVGLIAGGHSGVPRYAVKLVEGLDAVAADHPDVDLQLLTTPEGARGDGDPRDRDRDDTGRRALRQRRAWPLAARAPARAQRAGRSPSLLRHDRAGARAAR